jgi:2-dehydropantoate 2-reductase
VGSLGIGGFFGGRLAHAGYDVSFVARGEQLAAIRHDGLRVESVDGDFDVSPASATDDPRDIGEVDYVLVCVKTWQLRDVAAGIGSLLGANTAVVTVQNGVEAPAELAEITGRQRILPGVAKVFTQVAGPGRVRHLGGPGSLAFAEWDNTSSSRAEQLRKALVAAGVAVDEPPDIWSALWSKFLFVVPLGGLGAVSRAPVGIVRSVPETRQMLEAGMAEIRDVASARGVGLADGVVLATLAFVDQQPAAGRSSLQRDIAVGKPSELEAWNGAVTRLGRDADVATPVNTFIYQSLLPQERRARGRLSFAD